MQALLDFEDLLIYAKNPVSCLEVKSGDLYLDGVCIGPAVDLGKALNYLRVKIFFLLGLALLDMSMLAI